MILYSLISAEPVMIWLFFLWEVRNPALFLCSGRQVNYAGSGSALNQINCALSECPSFFPVQSVYGSCFASLSEAERDLGYDVVNENNTDTFKDNGTSIPMPETGECPDDFPFAGWRKCFSCDTPEDLNLSEEDCLKCPNRVYKVYPNWHVSQCERLCPPDKPLMDSESICYACNTPVPIGLDYNNRLCERFCPNQRHLIRDACVLNEK